MRLNKHNATVLLLLTFSLVFSGLLFGQNTLDHKRFLEKLKHSGETVYKECIDEYDTYLEKFPNDVSVLIEKCKFIQNAQFNEEEYFNPNQAAFDSCSAYVVDRFPTEPEVLLFQTTYLWGDKEAEVIKNAEQSIADYPDKWKAPILTSIYEAIANHYYYDEDYKQALSYMDKAIAHDKRSKYSLKYARILLALERKQEALTVLRAIPDTTDLAQQIQKADLLLELKDYTNALSIYHQVEQTDSTYIDNSTFASTLEGIGQYEAAREYLVADTSTNTFYKKEALIRLLNHDLKYQDGATSIATYNTFRDLGYSADPLSLHRLKLFFSHPTQPWQLRDLWGIASLLAILALLVIVPYVWILPVYVAGKKLTFLAPNAYESKWTLKAFWFVSVGYLLASLFASVVEPEELYALFTDSYYAGISTTNLGYQVLVFSIGMALFGAMAMYKVNPRVLLSDSWTIGKSIGIGISIFLLFKIVSGFYISAGTKLFDISVDEVACIPNLLLSSRQEIEAVISTFGKGSAIVLFALVVPLYEEIIFRGVILDSCQRQINFNAANIFQSALFAAVHGSLFLFPLFFFFGFMAGMVRQKSGGLLPGIILHVFNNLIAVLAFFIRLNMLD